MPRLIHNSELKTGMVLRAPGQRLRLNRKDTSPLPPLVLLKTDFGDFYLDPGSLNVVEEPGDKLPGMTPMRSIANSELETGMVLRAPGQRVIGRKVVERALDVFIYVETDFGVLYLNPDQKSEIEESGDEPEGKD